MMKFPVDEAGGIQNRVAEISSLCRQETPTVCEIGPQLQRVLRCRACENEQAEQSSCIYHGSAHHNHGNIYLSLYVLFFCLSLNR